MWCRRKLMSCSLLTVCGILIAHMLICLIDPMASQCDRGIHFFHVFIFYLNLFISLLCWFHFISFVSNIHFFYYNSFWIMSNRLSSIILCSLCLWGWFYLFYYYFFSVEFSWAIVLWHSTETKYDLIHNYN